MPSKTIRSFGATIALVVLAMLALNQAQAPGDSAGVEIQPTPPTTASTSVTTGPTETSDRDQEPDEPFTYRVGVLGLPSTSNYWSYFGGSPTVWDAYVLAPTKATLFRLDPHTLTLEPELASSIPQPVWDKSGWKAVVQLRGDNVWSDGRTLTAHDVVFTFDTVRRLELGGQWEQAFPEKVLDVSAIDDFTVSVAFDGRPGLDVWPHAVGTAPVMPQHFWATAVNQAATAEELYQVEGSRDPASGPTELVGLDPSIAASRTNPTYGRIAGSVAAVDNIEYVLFANENAVTDALIQGKVHTFVSPNGLSPDQRAQLEGAEGIETVVSPAFGVRFLGFNLDRAPMDQLAFREAVALLVDRDSLADTIAHAPASRSMIPSGNPAWFTVSKLDESVPVRSLTAKTLANVLEELKDVGYAWSESPHMGDAGEVVAGEGLTIDGREPQKLTILTAGDEYDPARRQYSEKVAESVALLGFEVIPVTTDFDTVIDLTFTPGEDGKLHYDMAILGWSLGNPGLPSFYSHLLGTGGAGNNTGYSGEEMDRLIDRYHAATDAETATDLLWQIESLIATDIPYLPLYGSRIVEVYRSDMIRFTAMPGLGGIQAASAGIHLVEPAG